MRVIAIIVCVVVGVGCVASTVRAKVVQVPDILSIVETLPVDCFGYDCKMQKVYDSNNGAVCYIFYSHVYGGQSPAISCIK